MANSLLFGLILGVCLSFPFSKFQMDDIARYMPGQGKSPIAAIETTSSYTTEILSLSPLMIYINNFISIAETEYLLNLGEAYYNGRLFTDRVLEANRSPRSAALPKNDTVVAQVLGRAMEFLGFLDHEDYEAPWLASYEQGQDINMHYDPPPTHMIDRRNHDAGDSDEIDTAQHGNGRAYNRLTSFFVYLDDDCEGGGTYFPHVKGPPAGKEGRRFGRWKQEKEGDEGLVVNPMRGNAIFWVNMAEDGRRDDRSLHAGLPVLSGTKVGMNIWAKQYQWQDRIIG